MMSLKTATLIALIGVSLHLVLNLVACIFCLLLSLSTLSSGGVWPFQGLLSIILFNGSIVLFLYVLYSKQKD